MRHEVALTRDADADLRDLYRYILENDSALSAERVLNRIIEISNSLAHQPDRGSVPKELLALGIRDFRQVFFKPYRLVCRLHDARVVIYLIADGRRDFQTLLANRLLRKS